jgi:hypothetical protein
MFTISRLRRPLVLVGALFLLCCLPTRALAYHQMSTFVDFDWDASTLYNTVSGFDWYDAEDGCGGHTDYDTLAAISGPHGFSEVWTAGFGSATSAPLVDGDFWVSGGIVVDCPCGGTPSGGSGFPVAIRTTFFQSPVYIGDGRCSYANFACFEEGSQTCGNLPHVSHVGSSVCPPYMKVHFLLLSGNCLDAGFAFPQTGRGNCS